LHQNVPNPFNPTTTIRYDVAQGGGHVTLQIFDAGGRVVRTIVDGVESEGRRSVTWDGRSDAGTQVATGVYFYRLSAPGFTQTRKMVMLK
jgi:flagellar hook assembly protein FlgD